MNTDNVEFAVVTKGEHYVVNVIVAHLGFQVEGYNLVLIKDNVFCTIGMRYNQETEQFEN